MLASTGETPRPKSGHLFEVYGVTAPGSPGTALAPKQATKKTLTGNIMKKILTGAALGLLLSAAAAQAGPITYNYNFGGSLPGTLSFTLNAAPTTAQKNALTDIKSQITAFSATIDGQSFNIFNSCPFNCVSNLEFGNSGLFNLTFEGINTLTGGNLASLFTAGPNFSYYNQLTGHASSGTFTFAGTTTPTTAVPEPLTASVFGAGVMGLIASRRRKKARS